jgi:uncharacterized protein (TIGR02680 family)
MTASLPQPARPRWQPLRVGLIDLFYYDIEEFWFRDGRLLLRGNNGTGKSKVLALTLPFLLDGELSSHRVEPDADPKKRMDWNLLLGGEHPHPERLGYTWLEFGRLDDREGPQFRTLGCGLKAVTGRGISRHWFFTTSQRVGAGLSLVDRTGTALTPDRLAGELGEHGTVYERRLRDYRRAVDESLFGLGEQRYGALVDLLVQLRQPQLSKRPTERTLSRALTEALPPLDQAVVADVAEAFHSLEEDRDTLAAMVAARDAAEKFLGHYRQYAQVAARRRAELPRQAQKAYEDVNRQLADADARVATAERALGAAQQRLVELAAETKRLQARDEALRARPEMRSARELARAGDDARRLAEDARRQADQRDTARKRQEERQQRHRAATARLSTATEKVGRARRSAAEAATGARVARPHADEVDRLIDDRSPAADPVVPQRAATALAERQQRAIDGVKALIERAENAERTLTDARRKVMELDAEADELAERRRTAGARLLEYGIDLVRQIRAHLDGATELRLPDLAATLAQLELWVETVDGANPAVAAVSTAGQRAAHALAVADTETAARQRDAERRRDELAAETERLERGEVDAPPAPYTRDLGSRDGRPGAPLWQLVDFAEAVSPADHAGIEAALEAAGILDAWLTPGGELLAADSDDVVLRPDEPAATNVGAVLVPAVDRQDPQAATVSDDAVAALLATIGLATGGEDGLGETDLPTWVAPDGRFRIGVLRGAWHKPAARYVGRGAREAARRARLAELWAESRGVAGQLAGIAAEREHLEERTARLNAEVHGLPSDYELRQAHSEAAALVREHERLARRRAAAAQVVAEATTAADAARTALTEAAGDAGLPVGAAELASVDRAVAAYRLVLERLWPAVDERRTADAYAAETGRDLDEAEADLIDATERAAAAAQDEAAAEEHRQTLQDTVGAAVAELERQLAAVAERRQANEKAHDAARRQADQAINAKGEAQGSRNTLAGRLEETTTERAAAAESFQRFAATGLLAVALPELETPAADQPWSPDPTVRLARRVDSELGGVDMGDDAWDRAQRRVNVELKSLQDALSRQGNRASADLRDDGVVVEVEFRGRLTTVPALSGALTSDVADRERLLTEREREILENHLVNEVASTLQELISAAEARVDAMNAELRARPTSTGMQLRLLWRPRDDGPDGLAAARERLLRQTADAWSPEDRAAVGEFLQGQIAVVRAGDAGGTWLEQLTEALDYRKWNRFVIQRYQQGQWRSATGPASGGEWVLAASVPLFAAASAHYESAGNPYAPRLVTLDEAFAGVDDNARATYLGLLAAFDLDVVMTSEREWGCYPEVPGLAISHLSRTDGVAAVLVTNWEWDGTNRTRVSPPVHSVTDDRPEWADDDQPVLWS